MKIYLDTNIIICGSKYHEHKILKRLARSGIIRLYISPEVIIEHGWRSLQQCLESRHQSFTYKESEKADTVFDRLRSALAEQERLETNERYEINFWRGYTEQAQSTFNSLVVVAILGDSLLSYADFKQEIELFEKLLTMHRLRKKDALHAMHAHSAGMDYLLTWDEKFIKKLKHVPWYRPVAIKPPDFLQFLKQKGICKN